MAEHRILHCDRWRDARPRPFDDPQPALNLIHGGSILKFPSIFNCASFVFPMAVEHCTESSQLRSSSMNFNATGLFWTNATFSAYMHKNSATQIRTAKTMKSIHVMNARREHVCRHRMAHKFVCLTSSENGCMYTFNCTNESGRVPSARHGVLEKVVSLHS